MKMNISFLVPIFLLMVAMSADASCPPAASLSGCTCRKELKDNLIKIVCSSKVKLDDLSIENLLQALLKTGVSPTIEFSTSKGHLTQVPTSLSKLSKLTNIHMRDNQITSIPSGAFQSSSQTLMTIVLRQNKISSIEPGAFDYPKAESIQLDLNNNSISTIPPGVFEGTGNFTYIDLGNNAIVRFEESIFKPMLSQMKDTNDTSDYIVTGINFADNPIDCSTDRCHLTWIFNDNNTKLLKFAWGLTCNGGLAFIDLDPYYYTKEKCTVDLSGNAEVVCPPAAVLGEFTCVKSWFDPTGITVSFENKGLNDGSVDEVLQALSEPSISPTIEFAVYNSSLTKVPTNLSNLPELSSIWLHENQITSISSGAFKSSRTYIKINLSKNLISSIEPGAFNYPNALYSELNLSYNKLTAIPAGVFEGAGNSFSLLFLRGNKLTRFEEGIFKPILEKIKAEDTDRNGKPGIYISDNPLDCSTDMCHLAWLIRDNPLLGKYVVGATCSNGTRFTSLRRSNYKKCP